MPAQDGTGPLGKGPLTGRGLGPCQRAFARQGYGNGFRCGFGRSFGLRQGLGFMQTAQPIQPVVLTQDEEKEILQEDLKQLRQEMQEVEKRLKELKA